MSTGPVLTNAQYNEILAEKARSLAFADSELVRHTVNELIAKETSLRGDPCFYIVNGLFLPVTQKYKDDRAASLKTTREQLATANEKYKEMSAIL